MTIPRILTAMACMLMVALPAQAAAPRQSELDALRKRVEQAPENPEALFELVMAYARTSYLEQGWEVFKRVNALDPAYADKVVSRYGQAIALNPSDVEAHFRLAFGYYFQGKKDLAGQEMGQVVALAPSDPWGYNYMGCLAAEQERMDEAASLWQKALVSDPTNAVAHYLMGQVYYRQGKFMQAAASLSNALKFRNSNGLRP